MGWRLRKSRRFFTFMDITALENYLWEAACSIRGPMGAPTFKDYILALLFDK